MKKIFCLTVALLTACLLNYGCSETYTDDGIYSGTTEITSRSDDNPYHPTILFRDYMVNTIAKTIRLEWSVKTSTNHNYFRVYRNGSYLGTVAADHESDGRIRSYTYTFPYSGATPQQAEYYIVAYDQDNYTPAQSVFSSGTLTVPASVTPPGGCPCGCGCGTVVTDPNIFCCCDNPGGEVDSQP